MVEKKIATYLDKLGSYLRDEYPTETTADLEHIAKAFFKVSNIYHSLDERTGTSSVSVEKGVISIHYFAFTYEGEKLVLGHEMGHIAAGHMYGRDGRALPHKICESEANYFSARLNGLSDRDYERLREADKECMLEVLESLREDVEAVSSDFRAVFADLNKVIYGSKQSVREEMDLFREQMKEFRRSLRSPYDGKWRF
jgi:hypothetical protein